MKSVSDDWEIPIPCDNCGKETVKTVRWLKSNRQLTCDCGITIDIDASDLLKSAQEVDRSVAKLSKTIKRMNKRL